MRLIYVCVSVCWLLGLFLPTALVAQNRQTAPKTIRARPEKPANRFKTKFGVFGHFHGAVTWGFFDNLQKDLEKPKFFSENWTLNNLGTNYGGNLFVRIGSYLMVGGGGNGFTYDASLASFAKGKQPLENEQGEARQHGYYLTPMVGVVILDRGFHEYDYASNQYTYRYRWMMYPYLGLGVGGKNTLKLSNYSQETKYFGTPPASANEAPPANTVSIPRSEFREFTTSMTMLELGLGTKFMKNEKGGIMVGGELGAYFNLGKGTWKEKEKGTEIKGVNDATMTGLYLRVTVGGGFMSNKAVVAGKGSSSSGGDDGYVKPDEVKEEKPKKEKKKKGEEAQPEQPAGN